MLTRNRRFLYQRARVSTPFLASLYDRVFGMQIKSLVRYPVDIRRARRLLSARRAPSDAFWQRPIVLDLMTGHMLLDCGRHLATIAHYAQATGSPLLIRCNQLLLSGIARKIHGREVLGEPYVWWFPRQQDLQTDALILRDHDSQQIGIRMLIGRDSFDGVPTMPYPMHPATLPFADKESLTKFRRQPGRGGLFFAGNQKPKYGDDKMTRQFGMLPRLEVLGTLRDQFSNRVAASVDELGDSRQIVLSDSRVESIEPARWLPSIARANFFVCCPGASQPTCHNLIEAMSVGTIPLIEYGDRVTPALQDGVNAITFQGRDGLVDAVRRIDAMTSDQINAMSCRVAEFYDRHLCGKKFISGLRDGQIDPTCGRICMPFHDRNLFDQTQDVFSKIAA